MDELLYNLNKNKNIQLSPKEKNINCKKISIPDLIEFIKKNIKIINKIGSINLDDVYSEPKSSSEKNTLEQLEFQDMKKVTFLPEKLNKLFDCENVKFIHCGVLKNINDGSNSNISFYSSIFTCLKQTFISQFVSSQNNFILTFLKRICSEIKGRQYNKKYKLCRIEICNNISKNIIDSKVIKFISDFLHINIFILDIVSDVLLFFDDSFVPYKKSVFLIKYDKVNFEPIFSEHTKFFTISDNLIKNIVLSIILIDNLNIVQEDLSFYSGVKNKEVIKETIKEETKKINAYDEIVSETENGELHVITFDESKNENKDDYEWINELKYEPCGDDSDSDYEDTEVTKVGANTKISELRKIAKNLNISIEIEDKKKSKKQLLTEINSYLC
jgi:hypothetical protein